MSNNVVTAAIVLLGFSVAHVLEDFVYGIPAKFGFEVAPAAALLGVAFSLQATLIVMAGRGSLRGYLGNALVGAGWVLALVFDHGGEILFAQNYRAGWISKFFEVGLALAALVLSVVSFVAWRRSRERTASA